MFAATSQLTYSSTVGRTPPARRRITPEAGYALEKLSHAIEYLADEYVDDHSSPFPDRGRIEAIELLMSINRSVYAESPEIPSIARRISSWLRRAA